MVDHVQQIKDRLDIVDVVGSYIKLQKAGVNFKARCPFHNEKTPSFNVSPERQIWHCFGCAKGGDMFTFVQDMEGVEFPEALRILAAKAGVELKQFDARISNTKTRLFEICELATKFFEKQLYESNNGKLVFNYLIGRGVKTETAKEFRLGFAPNDWQALSAFLQNCGYSNKEIADAGVAINKDGRIYDRFRSRIIFPIADANGQIVGFTGRIFAASAEALAKEEGQAKYINTPQTLIYDKSRVLYGLDKSKIAIRQADNCLLVEGNMDALMSFQAGVRNVVATSGTALTREQIKTLKRYTTKFDFCFDSDQAGLLATRRGIALALSDDCNLRIVEINDPLCKDPADYVVKYGDKWVQVASQAKPVIEYYFEKACRTYRPESAESKRALIASVGPLVNHLASSIERAHWVAKLATFLRVPEDAVVADLAVVKDDISIYEPATAQAQPGAALPKTEVDLDILNEAILSIFLKNPELFQSRLESLDLRFLDARVADIFRRLIEYQKRGQGAVNMDAITAKVEPEEAQKLEFAYLRSQELWNGFTDEQLLTEFETLFRKVQQRSILARLTSLTFDVKNAEINKDKKKLSTLTVEFAGLTQKLSELYNA